MNLTSPCFSFLTFSLVFHKFSFHSEHKVFLASISPCPSRHALWSRRNIRFILRERKYPEWYMILGQTAKLIKKKMAHSEKMNDCKIRSWLIINFIFKFSFCSTPVFAYHPISRSWVVLEIGSHICRRSYLVPPSPVPFIGVSNSLTNQSQINKKNQKTPSIICRYVRRESFLTWH